MITPANENELDLILSEPYPETVDLMARLDGDIIILGVAGKMGPSLAIMAARACKAANVSKRIIGVARFSDPTQQELLERNGVETIKCDLSNPDEVATLPKVKNVLFLAGRKFGEIGSEALTWVMNVLVPGNVVRAFAGGRIVAFSTGCVYALVPSGGPGSSEQEEPDPVGEYANSCLGRERIFEFASRNSDTSVLLYRLNYALDLRYGVLADIGRAVWEGRPVSLSAPSFNAIWQGDANNRALLCLAEATSPASALNITGPELLQTREVALRFGKLMDKRVEFAGEAGARCFLSDATKSQELFGVPRVSADELLRLTAEWIMAGGRDLNKPTHFQVTDGQFLDEAKKGVVEK